MKIFKLAGLALACVAAVACSTIGNPRTDLAASETVFGSAQQWWIDNCVNAKAFTFCTDSATVATVKSGSATATAAAQTATDAVLAKTLDAPTIALLTADAVNDATAFAALIANLKTKK
jgi:hypothetical protein